MRFGERIVECNCFVRGGPGFGKRITWRSLTPVVKQVVTVRQPGVGESIIWIHTNRLLEVIGTLLQTLFRPLPPEESSFQVKLIRSRRSTVAVQDLVLLATGEADSQICGNIPRELPLQSRDVGHVPLVLLPPELRPAAD